MDPTLNIVRFPVRQCPHHNYFCTIYLFILQDNFWHMRAFNAAQAFSFTSKLVFGYLHISDASCPPPPPSSYFTANTC